MSRDIRRVQLAQGYVLHQYPYRDTSLIVEVFTREQGRMTVFARAARGPNSRFIGLQPFRALLLSWSGRGDAPQLTAAEAVDAQGPVPSARLMPAFYLNELLLKLTTRHDPHPELFDLYAGTLAVLRVAEIGVEVTLRRFEKRLLDLIGYGLNFGAEIESGRAVRRNAYYHFNAGVGVVAAAPDASGAIPGRVLLSLARAEDFGDEDDLRHARTLMRAALDHCLEGRELRTRTVAKSLTRRERRA